MTLIFEVLLGLMIAAVALVWVVAEVVEDWWRGKK
jgi:hypothetical protein